MLVQPVCLDPNRQLATQEIEASRQISRYYTPAGSNSIKYSSYGARVAIVEQRALDRAKVFTSSIDQQAVDRLNAELRDIQREKLDWSRRAAENAELDKEFHDRIEAYDKEKAALTDERDALQLPLKKWLRQNTKLGKLAVSRSNFICAQVLTGPRARADSMRETLRKEKAKPTAEAKAKELRDRLAKVTAKAAQLSLRHEVSPAFRLAVLQFSR